MYACQRTVRASRSNPRERWCIHSQIAFTSHLQMDGTHAHISMCMCSFTREHIVFRARSTPTVTNPACMRRTPQSYVQMSSIPLEPQFDRWMPLQGLRRETASFERRYGLEARLRLLLQLWSGVLSLRALAALSALIPLSPLHAGPERSTRGVCTPWLHPGEARR